MAQSTPYKGKPAKPLITSNHSSSNTTPLVNSSLSHLIHPASPPDASSSGGAASDLSKVRAYAACRSCRVKKIKCLPRANSLPTINPDGTTGPGACQQCTTAGVECTYPPTRDRAAYSRQYVQNLEARVQALETTQLRMLPIIEAYEGGSMPRASGSRPSTTGTLGLDMGAFNPELPAEEPPTDAEGHMETSSTVDGPEDDDAAVMTTDDRGNYRWLGSNNPLALLDSFSHNRSPHEPTPPRTASGDPGNNPYFGAVAGSGVVKALPGVDEVSYPTPERAGEMVDAFFAEIYPVLPVVPERAFREEYTALMDRRAKNQPEIPGGFVSVLFAVFALGERALVTSAAWRREKQRSQEIKGKTNDDTVLPGEAEAGVIWYERAQILHYTTLRDVNIRQVQCLTLMAAFQASVNAMPMSWLLAGQAIRVAQDLGLHRSTARLRISFAEKQVRSRCWWAIYGLERLVSITLGRPLAVQDDDIDVALPLPVDDEALSSVPKTQHDSPGIGEEPHGSTISGFISLTKLCRIAGRVAHVLYRPSPHKAVSDPAWSVAQQGHIKRLDESLKQWLDNDVPAKYKDPASTARPIQLVSAILSNTYFAVLLTLHRNFLPSNPDYPRPRPTSNSQSLSQVVEAARSVIHVAAQQRVALPPSHHLAAACHNLWSSAIILLLCEVQAKDQIVVDAVGSSVESCRQTLQTLEPAWPGARKLKELLVDVEARMKEVAVDGTKTVPVRPKKRKSSTTHDLSPAKRASSNPIMPPPTFQSPRLGGIGGATWNNYTFTSSAPSRSRDYEMSDTRSTRSQEEAAVMSTNSATSGKLHIPRPDLSRPASFQQMPEPDNTGFDMSQLFNIEGVNFDGLGMLQGFDFTDTSTSTFWNSFISPTAAANYTMSGQSTPGSGGMGGPSPSSWQVPSQGMAPQMTDPMGGAMNQVPMQSGQVTGQNGQNGQGMVGSFDFWSQVAPGGFDWAADPSVPFNV